MLSTELNRLAVELLNEIQSQILFVNTVAELAAAFEPVPKNLIAIVKGGGEANAAVTILHRHFVSTNQITSKIIPRQFYKSLDCVHRILESAFSSGFSGNEMIFNLILQVDSFAAQYDTYLNAQSGMNAVNLIMEAYLLNLSLTSLTNTLNFISENIEETPPIEANRESLSLILGQFKSEVQHLLLV
jgi:hypothetical protein